MLVVDVVVVLVVVVVLLPNVARPTNIAERPIKINVITGIDIKKQHLEQQGQI